MNATELVLQMSPLVGRYVDMTRPSTPDEVQAYGAEMMGASGSVVAVEDASAQHGEAAVDVVFDYGMGFTVLADDLPRWRFLVYADAETADELLPGARQGRGARQ